jgi:hypothetical protein
VSARLIVRFPKAQGECRLMVRLAKVQGECRLIVGLAHFLLSKMRTSFWQWETHFGLLHYVVV